MIENEVLKFIFENGLVSYMNNTKWRALVNAITFDENFDPSVNIKYIFDKSNNGVFSPVRWEEIKQEGFEIIEWIEISPIKEEYIGVLIDSKKTDYTIFIEKCLNKTAIPYEIQENGCFRINAYLRT